MDIITLQADYTNPQHANDLVYLLDHYARDPMGGNEPLSDHARTHLVGTLAKLPYAFSVLCYVDGKPAGLVNCMEGFSTFACQPLVNIHDAVVLDAFRGMGISQHLLEKVESIARSKGCCKLTLEVLEGNQTARHAYLKFGFDGYQLDPQFGKALFWQKKLVAA